MISRIFVEDIMEDIVGSDKERANRLFEKESRPGAVTVDQL